MAYQYDVFISYKRGWLVESWLTNQFLPLFSAYLTEHIHQYCDRDPSPIFLDQTEINENIRADRRLDNFGGIEPGARWQDALEHAIKHSRCLLAIWSPGYFRSQWCMKEWDSFQTRQTAAMQHLCEPIVIHDCYDPIKMPPDLAAIQAFRFNKTFFVGNAFTSSPGYLELQQLCDQLAESIARKIAEVPNFQNWPIGQGNPLPRTGPIGQFRIISS